MEERKDVNIVQMFVLILWTKKKRKKERNVVDDALYFLSVKHYRIERNLV